MSKCKIKKEEQNNVGQIQILKKKKDWEPSHKKYYDHMSRWVMEYYKEINLGSFLPVNPDGNFFWKYDSDGELVDKNGYGICLDGPLSEYNRMVKRKLEYDDLLEIFENGVKYGIDKMKREFLKEEFDFVLGYSNYDEKKVSDCLDKINSLVGSTIVELLEELIRKGLNK